METDRQRKRDSARKKRDFSVYSQKAVRATTRCWAKERVQRAKPVVVQEFNGIKLNDNGPYGPIGQNMCLVKAKGDMNKTKPTKK